jgi:hypothetical protein
MGYTLTRLPIVLWGVILWALLPVMPRSWGMTSLHLYLRVAYTWRRRWIPSRARLVARWADERHAHHR